MTLGEKIRAARRKCGLSQEQLAEKMSVSRSAIAKWETDKGLPDVGNLKVLARLLNVSVDHLLDDEGSEECPVIRERYSLASYGRGCKRVRKDRVVREKFADGTICSLLARKDMTDVIPENGDLLPCSGADSIAALREQDKEFYLVEQSGRQFLVTVTDEFVQTKLLEQSIEGNQFSFDGWDFIKCNL